MSGRQGVPGRVATVGVLGAVCLASALLTFWLLGVPGWAFAVVFVGLAVLSLVRPPND